MTYERFVGNVMRNFEDAGTNHPIHLEALCRAYNVNLQLLKQNGILHFVNRYPVFDERKMPSLLVFRAAGMKEFHYLILEPSHTKATHAREANKSLERHGFFHLFDEGDRLQEFVTSKIRKYNKVDLRANNDQPRDSYGQFRAKNQLKSSRKRAQAPRAQPKMYLNSAHLEELDQHPVHESSDVQICNNDWVNTR